MKKDFYLLVILTIFFLGTANFPAGPVFQSWRLLADYLIYPSTQSLLAAYRHSSHLGESWSRLLEARVYLDRFNEQQISKGLESLRLAGIRCDQSLSPDL